MILARVRSAHKYTESLKTQNQRFQRQHTSIEIIKLKTIEEDWKLD